MKKQTLVVNLIGAPGTGKSTMAAEIFSKLKWLGVDCELVSEFAKELVWEERNETFKDEIYLFAKQNHRMFRLDGKVDVIITDRPILLSVYYNRKYGSGSKCFDELVIEEHNRYFNLNVLLSRKKEYNPNGRNQSESESDMMQVEISELMKELYFPVVNFDATSENAQVIVDKVVHMLKK